ncbi:MBL fold metallo-hydrolase [Candidatus Roizmanbacteria bacterium]|nr:MBL fold metallo-hydrolase [Candidatus Roizmanbacteria bacterium]
MQVFTFIVGQLQTNCYLLVEHNECMVIDPGDAADFVTEQIQRRNLTLRALIATHGHFDHILAAGEIQLSFSIPLYIFKEDLFLVQRLNETAQHFLGFDPQAMPPQSTEWLTGGSLTIDAFTFKVILTPGHTPGSCCFYFPNEKTIFTGDTLFKQGIGRYDFSYSDGAQLHKSLNTLFSLPEETKVYSGHGAETTIGAEKQRRSL